MSKDIYFIKRILYKIQDKLLPRPKPIPEGEKEIVILPEEGRNVSVETALNSRCSSDSDGNPFKFHWGMFERAKKLSDKQINKVISFAAIPRFTEFALEVKLASNILTFSVDNKVAGIYRDWVMVESGMQQQAIGLICAALGISNVLQSLGDDGRRLSETEWGIIRMKLSAMKPSYSGSFWTTAVPSGARPWKRGNLPDPSREGKKPLIAALKAIKTLKRTGREATDESVSQLLWAARGRTPHFYKSQPWGMTIPTSQGMQNISSVYLLSNYSLYKYVNWHKNKPTHSLETLGEINVHLRSKLAGLFQNFHTLVVLARNEDFATALCGVGYQLLNMLVQADALNLDCEAILLNEEQRRAFQETSIHRPVAALLLKRK